MILVKGQKCIWGVPPLHKNHINAVYSPNNSFWLLLSPAHLTTITIQQLNKVRDIS